MSEFSPVSEQYEFITVRKPSPVGSYPIGPMREHGERNYRSLKDFMNELIDRGLEGYRVVDDVTESNGINGCTGEPRAGTYYVLMQRQKPI